MCKLLDHGDYSKHKIIKYILKKIANNVTNQKLYNNLIKIGYSTKVIVKFNNKNIIDSKVNVSERSIYSLKQRKFYKICSCFFYKKKYLWHLYQSGPLTFAGSTPTRRKETENTVDTSM